MYGQGCEGCSCLVTVSLLTALAPVTSLPGAGPTFPQRRLTVVGAIVSVADAEVAPAILHAVPAIWALRVHVARCGGNF